MQCYQWQTQVEEDPTIVGDKIALDGIISTTDLDSKYNTTSQFNSDTCISIPCTVCWIYLSSIDWTGWGWLIWNHAFSWRGECVRIVADFNFVLSFFVVYCYIMLRYSSVWKLSLQNHSCYIPSESSRHQEANNHHIFCVASNDATLWVTIKLTLFASFEL